MKQHDDNEIAASLRVVLARLLKIMRRESKNDDLLSLTERSTLSLIDQQVEVLPSTLATTEKVTTQSMSQIINKLYKAGYIKKTASKEDKRNVIVSVSPLGKKFIEARRQAKQEWLANAITERTTAKEKEILVNAIPILTKLID